MSIFTQTPPKQVFYGLHPDSPAGSLMIGVTADGFLCRVAFAAHESPTATLKRWRKEWPRTDFVDDPQKIRLLSKKLAKADTLPLLLVGSPFQLKVWKALLSIKPGDTVSYGALARKIGKPTAARAIGGAVGANPIPLIVPCHRVIASDGSLGGFSGGINIKSLLLKKEGTGSKAN